MIFYDHDDDDFIEHALLIFSIMGVLVVSFGHFRRPWWCRYDVFFIAMYVLFNSAIEWKIEIDFKKYALFSKTSDTPTPSFGGMNASRTSQHAARLRRTRTLLNERQRMLEHNPLGFQVVIVGRPNVGKSTLYNRMIAKTAHTKAIVESGPGVTRDRQVGQAQLFGMEFDAIDTAGLEERTEDAYEQGQILESKRTKKHKTAQKVYNQNMKPEVHKEIMKQTEKALEEADVVCFVVDAREGVTHMDKHFAMWLRRKIKRKKILLKGQTEQKQHDAQTSNNDCQTANSYTVPVILIANKCENAHEQSLTMSDALTLGFGEPIAISAEHNIGTDDLYHALRKHFENAMPRKQLERKARQPASIESDVTDPAAVIDVENMMHLRLAVVGRPNAGKSTLVNALLGAERLITGAQPGITRDSIVLPWPGSNPNENFSIVDTAGLSGVAAITRLQYGKVDAIAMEKSLHSIDMANVVALVLDGSAYAPIDFRRKMKNNDPSDLQILRQFAQPVFSQHDLSIGRYVLQQGRVLLLLINKWDLVPKALAANLQAGLNAIVEQAFPAAKGIPMMFISALHKDNLSAIRSTAQKMFLRWDLRITTGKLNAWLRATTAVRPHPNVAGKKVTCKFLTQIKIRPPTFAVFVNRPSDFKEDYQRFLLNGLRTEFDLDGLPLRLVVRAADNPFSPNAQ